MIYGFTFTSIILKRLVFGLIRRQERPDVSRDNSFAYDLLYGTGYCKHESVPRATSENANLSEDERFALIAC